MRAKQILFLSVILSFFFIFSCNYNDEGIGENLLPDEDILKPLLSDTITVELYTERVDTLATSQVTKVIVGQSNDPIFGYTEASFALQFDLTSNFTFKDDIVIEDIHLNMYHAVGDSAYGVTNRVMNLEVYELSEQLFSDSTYYSNLQAESLHNGNLLGSSAVYPLELTDSIPMRIPLTNELGTRFMQAPEGSFDNDTVFQKFFKGIYVKASGSDALLKLSIDTGAYILINYHNTSAPDTKLEYRLYCMNSNNTKLNLYSHDYSQSWFAEQINSGVQSNYAYIQGLAGTKVKIRFPYLETLKTLDKLNLYRAELILPVAEESYSLSSKYPEAKSLMLTGEDSEGGLEFLQEYLTSSGSYSGEYFNETDLNYSFNLTKYIHSVLYEEKENRPLTLSIIGGSTNMYRTVLHTGKNDIKRAKIVLTYTELTK